MLQNLIDEHQPRFVVMYGTTYRQTWERMCGSKLNRQREPELSYGKRGSTQMILITHPVAKGVTNVYFDSIGRYLQRAKSSR